MFEDRVPVLSDSILRNNCRTLNMRLYGPIRDTYHFSMSIMYRICLCYIRSEATWHIYKTDEVYVHKNNLLAVLSLEFGEVECDILVGQQVTGALRGH